MQLCVDVERKVEHEFTGKVTGIDLGLESFCTDSDGFHIENAAINILAKALEILGLENKTTVGRTESGAWEENTLYLELETVLGKVTR